MDIKIAEEAAAAIDSQADVVYFADWQANGIHFMRSRRFHPESGPTAVTVLHSPSRWVRQAMRALPHTKEDLWLDFSKAYTAKYSDFVVSPGLYMLEWVRNSAWELPPDERVAVCGLPYFPSAQTPADASRYDASMRDKLAKSRKDANTPTRTAPSAALGLGVAGSKGSLDQRFSRIVFFGRLETRKGLESFVEAVSSLRGRPCLGEVSEIVLLGSSGANRLGTPRDVARILGDAVPHGIVRAD